MPDEMKQRRFPRPWDIEEINKAAFVVRDNNGTALAYVYFEEEPGRRRFILSGIRRSLHRS